MYTAYFDACDPDDWLCRDFMDRNRADIARWQKLAPEPWAHDVDTFCAKVAHRFGTTAAVVRRNFDVIHLLGAMPRLAELAIELGHLDMNRLAAVERVVRLVSSDLLDEVEAAVVAELTPQRPSQHLPGPRQINTLVRAIIAELAPAALAEDAEETPRTIGFKPGEGSAMRMTGNMLVDEAYEVHAALSSEARRVDGTMVDALLSFVRGHAEAKVVFNIYGESPDRATSLGGCTLLDEKQGKLWAEAADTVRDLAGADTLECEGHDPSEKLKAYVRGRDGTCRFPGCTVDGEFCDLDHVVNWEDGGPTKAANLQCLCRHHHNMKTDGAVTSILSALGDVYWIYADGQISVSESAGIIRAPKADSLEGAWRQSFDQRRGKRWRTQKHPAGMIQQGV